MIVIPFFCSPPLRATATRRVTSGVQRYAEDEPPNIAMDQSEKSLTSLAADGGGIAGERSNTVEAPGVDIIGLYHP